MTVAVATVMYFSACDNNIHYFVYKHTPLSGWEKNDTLFFSVPPVEQSGQYRQEINMRTNETYPFTSLSLVVEQTIEPGHRLHTDTLNCHFLDEEGKHLGHGVSYYQQKFILTDVSLNKGDSISLTVRHIMKREILPGIADVGLKIYKH